MRPDLRPRMLFARGKPLFSIKDGAAYLGLTETTLRRRIAAGQVPTYPWGQRRLLRRADLDHYRHVLHTSAAP